jgi:hypothetical protein
MLNSAQLVSGSLPLPPGRVSSVSHLILISARCCSCHLPSETARFALTVVLLDGKVNHIESRHICRWLCSSDNKSCAHLTTDPKITSLKYPFINMRVEIGSGSSSLGCFRWRSTIMRTSSVVNMIAYKGKWSKAFRYLLAAISRVSTAAT